MTETDPKPHLITADNAAEVGRRGGLASAEARRKAKTVDELRKKGPEVLHELINAGLGQGKWSKLDLRTRLDALKAAVPYLIGRPPPATKGEEAPADEESDQAPERFTIVERKD